MLIASTPTVVVPAYASIARSASAPEQIWPEDLTAMLVQAGVW